MTRLIRAIATVLLVTSVATLALALRQYRTGRNLLEASYTEAVKTRDIVDAAHNAFNALNDAELRAENYVLTGETVYSDAYAADLRDWDDESGTLEVIAEKDPATIAVKDFVKAGKRTVAELQEVVSSYDKSGRDPAMDRIRKSTAIVYLDRSRRELAEILDAEKQPGTTSQLMTRGVASSRRVGEYAGGLALVSFVAATILLAAARPSHSPPKS